MARLPVLVRRSEVFDLVVAGKTYQEICQQLAISEDTVARDMQAIGDEVQALCRERAGEVLAFAEAHLLAVIDAAWSDYLLEARREREWLAGELDYGTLETATKGAAAGDVDGEEGIDVEASQALEITQKRGRRRPGWRSSKAKYLDIVRETIRELCELTGLKKVILEHQGKDGGPIEVNDAAMGAAAQELTEWRRQMTEQLSSFQSVSPMPPTS